MLTRAAARKRGLSKSESTQPKASKQDMGAPGELHAAREPGQQPRAGTGLQANKGMGQVRKAPSSGQLVSAFQQPQQQQPGGEQQQQQQHVPQQQQQQLQQQPGVHYASLDDLSSRVEIYKGRHSVVWNCVCRHTRKPVILKGYVKAQMTERNFHQVRREIRLMAIINYDGATSLLGSFEDATTIYIVQEMCAKGDLFKKLLRNGGSLEERYVASEVILPLLLTLEHLHARGIYHRDIKPENIFFTHAGRFKLGDFGLAIDTNLERSKSRVGTLDYMSPEVVSLPTADERKRMEAAGRPVPEQPYGAKCDVWAAGVLAYELMVGRPPFEVADEAETRKKIMFETTIKFPPHVSPEAIGFIKAVLAKAASQRPTAAELLQHAWLRPHLVALANRVAHLDAGALSVFRATPSLVASSSNALVAAAAKAASAAAAAAAAGGFSIAAGPPGAANSSSTGTAFAAGMAAGAAVASAHGVGRSASFSSLPSSRPAGPARGLFINVHDAGAAASAAAPGMGGGSGAASPAGSGVLSHHLQGLAMHLGAGGNLAGSPGGSSVGGGGGSTPSASMCMTPGPYGPPGVSRKPVWETDASPSAYTAVRTAGLSGADSPSSTPTSPHVKAGAGAFAGVVGGGGNSPLLKAALNANLARINAHQQQQQQQQQQYAPGALSLSGYGQQQQQPPAAAEGSLSASGGLISAAAGQLGAAGQPGVSSNVKQRIKSYFVARNPDLLPHPAGGGGGGVADSDCASYGRGAHHNHHGAQPMQH